MPRGGYRHGSGAKPSNTLDDFVRQIDKRGPTECWEWRGAKDRNGYGYFWYMRKPYKAHRLAFSVLKQNIPLNAPANVYENGFVLHHCDNKGCCNPTHLYIGNLPRNMKDKVARGRQSRLRGERHPLAKMTMADAARIREAHLCGGSNEDLSLVYGVTMRFINDVIKRRTYATQP